MKKGRKRYTKKSVMKAAIPAFILVMLVITLTHIIFNTEWLRPKINEITASYISLNTNEKTDALKISNLYKMSDNKGKGNNTQSQSFQITGEKDKTYQIVLYHIGNAVDESYVNYYLTNEKNEKMEGNLANKEQTVDGGRILYEGNLLNGKNWNLKMWIDKSYKEETHNISYEIRIKTR